MKTLCLVFLVLFAGFGFGSAVRTDDDVPTCRKCDSTGMRPCKKHPKDECELIAGALYCNAFDDCKVCGGLGFVDCEKCENTVADKELERRAQEKSKRAEKLKWIDEGMGRTIPKIESEHFVLTWEIERLKVDKKQRNQHELMHIYAERLEKLWTDYSETMGASRRHFQKKSHVFVWWLPKDQQEASLRFCENSGRSGVKLLGANPRYSMCGNKQFAKNDEVLHRTIVHNVAHLLLSHHSPSQWIGHIKGGWLDAGLAHWFEDRYWQRCTNYCYQEQNTMVDFKGGKYKPAVRKLVAADKAPSAAGIFQKNTDNLTPEEHAFSMSYVDYLISIDGKKLSKVAAMLKQRKPTRDALKAVYGMNPLQFEERWKAWVLETYPVR